MKIAKTVKTTMLVAFNIDVEDGIAHLAMKSLPVTEQQGGAEIDEMAMSSI
jgi:hypothetical protein